MPNGPTIAGFPWNDDCDRVLAAAANLDPDDRSDRAEYLREVAESIRDHRSSPDR